VRRLETLIDTNCWRVGGFHALSPYTCVYQCKVQIRAAGGVVARGSSAEHDSKSEASATEFGI